ncbi:Nephrocystin-3 [Trichoplax sp. H2]|nr:Nephrocystin-3 [Trichoplax sp. H2]|eukprot:RDD37412.1 Nephrocystin-3 [Trichoplax sp. H2]
MEIKLQRKEANKLFKQGSYEEARSLYRQVLDRIGGSNVLPRFEITLQIVKTSIYLQDYEIAKSDCESAKLLARRLSDKKLLQCEKYLGEICHQQGNHEDALQYYNLAYRLSVQINGSKHLTTADISQQIGDVYVAMQHYSDALTSYKQALKVRQKRLTKFSKLIANSYFAIGNVYSCEREYKLAITNFQESLAIRHKLFENNHLLIADCYERLAQICNDQCKFHEAASLFEKCLKIYLVVGGKTNFDVAQLYRNIGLAKFDNGDHGEALSSHQKCLEICINIYGEEHPNVAMSYSSLASIYYQQEEYQQAYDMFRKSLDINLKVLGSNHWIIADTYHNIGNIHYNQEKCSDALKMYQVAMFMRLKQTRNDHIRHRIADSYFVVANVYAKQSKYHDALEMFLKSFSIFQNLYGESNIVAIIYQKIAELYDRDGRADDANDMRSRASEIFDRLEHGQIPTPIQTTSPDVIVVVVIVENDYFKAYMIATIYEECHSDCTRLTFIGPSDSGKNFIVKLLTKQNLTSPYVAENTEAMLDLSTGNIFKQKTDDYRKIVGKKIAATMLSITQQMESQYKMEESSLSELILSKIETVPEANPTIISSFTSEYDENRLEERISNTDTNLNASPSTQYASVDTRRYLDTFNDFMQQSLQLCDADNSQRSYYSNVWEFGSKISWNLRQLFTLRNSIYILTLDITEATNQTSATNEERTTLNTFLDSIKECLVSVLDGHCDDAISDPIQVDDADLDVGIYEEFALPVVIFVGFHDDCVTSDTVRIFNNLTETIFSTFPQYSRHIIPSDVVFNCNPKDTSSYAIEQRETSCQALRKLIQHFTKLMPVLQDRVPIRWHILLSILHKSVINDGCACSSNSSNFPRRVMSVHEVEELLQDCGLFRSDQDTCKMLQHLHDLGEILYVKPDYGKEYIITQVEWLAKIFQVLFASAFGQKADATRRFSFTRITKIKTDGIMKESHITNVLREFSLDDKEKEAILQLLENYNIICPRNNANANNESVAAAGREYFVPIIITPNFKSKIDIGSLNDAGYHVSESLYIQFEDNSYIPDVIFYPFLISCLRKWNNLEAELFYRGAKLFLENDLYYLLIVKERSKISLRYFYKKSTNLSDELIKKLVWKSRPQELIQGRFFDTAKKYMPKSMNSSLANYVKCSECGQFLNLFSFTEDSRCKKCIYCGKTAKSMGDWINLGSTADTRRHFFTVAKEIGIDWEKLAGALGIHCNETSVIDAENKNYYNKANQLLEKWYTQNYCLKATYTLACALDHIERRDILAKLKFNSLELSDLKTAGRTDILERLNWH